jgi:hypothetical protein
LQFVVYNSCSHPFLQCSLIDEVSDTYSSRGIPDEKQDASVAGVTSSCPTYQTTHCSILPNNRRFVIGPRAGLHNFNFHFRAFGVWEFPGSTMQTYLLCMVRFFSQKQTDTPTNCEKIHHTLHLIRECQKYWYFCSSYFCLRAARLLSIFARGTYWAPDMTE